MGELDLPGASTCAVIRPMRHFALMCLMLFPSLAAARDVVFVPDVIAEDPLWSLEATELQEAAIDAFEASDLVVLRPQQVETIIGPLVRTCPEAQRAGCTGDALMSLPVRVGVLLSVKTIDNKPFLSVSILEQSDPMPLREMTQPLMVEEMGRQMLRLSLFAYDVFDEIGPSPPSMVANAERLQKASEPAPEPTRRDEFSFDEDIPGGLSLDDESLLDEGFGDDIDFDGALEDTSFDPASRSASVVETGDRRTVVSPPAREISLAPKHTLGARKNLSKWAGSDGEWLAARRPHGGRVILELRGGGGFLGVDRQLDVLGLKDPANPGFFTQTLAQDGPVSGGGFRTAIFFGGAPSANVDLGVLGEAQFGRQKIRLGYMADGLPPELGEASFRMAPTFAVHGRMRVYPLHLGLAKVYMLASGGVAFVPDYAFTVTSGEPYPQPRGGIRPEVGGGAGVVFDPTPRFGILIEMAAIGQLGEFAGERFIGAGVGIQPTPIEVLPVRLNLDVGLQMRF